MIHWNARLEARRPGTSTNLLHVYLVLEACRAVHALAWHQSLPAHVDCAFTQVTHAIAERADMKGMARDPVSLR